METSIDKKLTNFAFKLALIEKAASTLGTMNFIWATAVLLGGFSQSLKSIDFWFVSVILVVEGLRILCRRGELATRRSWFSGSLLPLFIYQYSLAIQEYSATACIVLSSLRIQKQQYGSDGNLNRNRALNIFYVVSLVESSSSLLGFVVRLFFSRSSDFDDIPHIGDFIKKVGRSLIFIVVGKNRFSECGFNTNSDEHLNMVQRFFDEAFSRCINGSVFDGLKMDFVSYSMEILLQSIDDDEELSMGAQLLLVILKSDRLPPEKLRAIGTNPGVLDRLIELLNREKPLKIRTVAAKIISKLLEIPGNCIRVIAFPDSIESILSLLHDRNQQGRPSYLSEVGLCILKILANDPDNWAKLKTNEVLLRQIKEAAELDFDLPEEILDHLKSLQWPASPGRERDDRENINATSGSEAEQSDHQNLQPVDSQV